MSEIKISMVTQPKALRDLKLLQRAIWGPGYEVPTHMLIAAVGNGGVALVAYDEEKPVGFVFGFSGMYRGPSGSPKLMHASHMLGVLPTYRSAGLGYELKRAQWQWVRQQGIELITWTYDPLLSTNARLNVARLGAICQVYYREYYGEMDDELNRGLASDRFQAEVWVNSARVADRMSGKPRRQLDLAHYFSVGAEIVNPTRINGDGLPVPSDQPWLGGAIAERLGEAPVDEKAFYLFEIPADFQSMRDKDPDLAAHWRRHSRALLEDLFARQYMVTDFIYLTGSEPRSFYVLSHGERTLG